MCICVCVCACACMCVSMCVCVWVCVRVCVCVCDHMAAGTWVLWGTDWPANFCACQRVSLYTNQALPAHTHTLRKPNTWEGETTQRRYDAHTPLQYRCGYIALFHRPARSDRRAFTSSCDHYSSFKCVNHYTQSKSFHNEATQQSPLLIKVCK